MRIRTARDLGALIRDRRAASGWSQQELADRCGASRRWVVAVEAGKSGAQIGMVLRALAVMDLELTAGPVPTRSTSALDQLLHDIDEDR